MKKIITLSAILLSTLMFVACGQKTESYVGYWQGEANMVFEVLQNGQDYIIRNVNGDLNASPNEGKICGENSLNMPYCMDVKGDSAYYEFGGITTGYKRIDKAQYDAIFATQKKATVN